MVEQDKKEFVINNHLTLKLEGVKTKIFVDGEEFLICKAVILNIPKNEVLKVKSMDDLLEISEIIKKEEDFINHGITPLTEFWIHCSNLQAWAENNYNTDLLQANLAFPLLKRLTETGDMIAKKRFREEIARKYAQGSNVTKSYLELEGFLDYLTMEEILVGGLDFEESSLLLDIIDLMKQKRITYEIVLSFDEDKVRHRLSLSERFLTLEKGHVNVLEFDLSQESAHLFNRFSVFKGMRNLIINLGDLNEQMLNISNMQLESLKALTIYNHSFLDIPSKIFNYVPNLKYLRIYSPFKSSLTKVDLIISLEKLKTLEFNDCFNKEDLKKLFKLKKKGVEIINIEKK